ncbi:MAG: ADP-ribosylation factor-like protein, partial [Promethearchaeota archaeon]
MDYRIKVIIIGEAGVGKTSLVKRFVSGHFTRDYRTSIGANIFIKELNLNSNETVSIQIWDIAGQER